MNEIMKILCLVAVLVVIGAIFGGVVSAKNVPENLTGSVADAENRDVVNYTSASDSLKSDPVLPFTIRIYRTKLSPSKTEIIPFETYVKSVLNDEWQGLWSDSCLDAGAVAVKMVIAQYPVVSNFISPQNSEGFI